MRFGSIRNAAVAAIAGIAIAATSLVSVTVSAAPAQAWSSTDFNPGNIIDDALFYRGTNMTAGAVQKFLNQQVPRCTLGDPGREVGKKVKWSGQDTKLASTCLKSYRVSTKSLNSNAYCKAYRGASSETAAQIIAKVGKACGINPKVLLITLEKEQSLVTDTWPNELQFARATGYDCPDSGPGDTAQCDPKQAGFVKQVYGAAWQLKLYKAKPKNYRYVPFQKNRIQWHPNASCGTSTVYIQNWATAALYIYTPYRPNKAALKAGWSRGDACSSYGNRNFFNLWNKWFGSVRSNMQITGPIKRVYDAAAHAAIEDRGVAYGDPTSTRKKIATNGGGYQMRFQQGVITYSKKYRRAIGLQDWALRKAYLDAGGAKGAWGFLTAQPTGSTAAGSDNRRLRVQNGYVFQSVLTPGVGVRFVPKPISSAYLAAGGPQGSWGWPKGSAKTLKQGKLQKFAKGYALYNKKTKKTVFVASKAYVDWKKRGGTKSSMGYPSSSTRVYADGSYQQYRTYVVFLGPKKTIRIKKGAATKAYLAAGGPARSGWGWPVAQPRTAKNGTTTERFSKGTLTISKKGKIRFVAR